MTQIRTFFIFAFPTVYNCGSLNLFSVLQPTPDYTWTGHIPPLYAYSSAFPTGLLMSRSPFILTGHNTMSKKGGGRVNILNSLTSCSYHELHALAHLVLHTQWVRERLEEGLTSSEGLSSHHHYKH